MESITAWMSDNAFDWGTKLAIAVAIFVLGRWLAKVISHLLKRGLRQARMDNLLVDFIGNIGHAILLIAVALAAIDSLGVNVTSLMAILGAAGLAIGLALNQPEGIGGTGFGSEIRHLII